MKTFTKIVISICFLTIIAGGLYYLFTERVSVSTNPPSPPKIISQFEGDYQIKIDIKESDFKFPETISTIQAKPSAFSKDEANKIADNLGFTLVPLEVNDTFDGKMLIYKNEEYSLIIALEKGTVDYTNETNPKPKAVNRLSDKEAISVAENFVSNSNIIKIEEIDAIGVSYFGVKEAEGMYQASKEKADLYQVNFSFETANNVKIITLTPQTSPFYVQLLPDGTILKAHIQKFDSVQKSDELYKIKTYKEFVSSINDSTLVSLDEGNLHLPDFSNTIKTLSLNSVSLGYLYQNSQLMQPIFILKGKVRINSVANSVSASLYLPALSQSP